MIDKKKKAQIIKKFATHENDTGSSEVQIALLTEEIKNLTDHLKQHKKDFPRAAACCAKWRKGGACCAIWKKKMPELRQSGQTAEA